MKSGCGVVGSGAGMTNNVAEYSALKRAAEWVSQNGGDDGDEIRPRVMPCPPDDRQVYE